MFNTIQYLTMSKIYLLLSKDISMARSLKKRSTSIVNYEANISLLLYNYEDNKNV